MQLTRVISIEEKWKAVISCNNEYDGLFYYAVKTTGIVCRPSCKAKAPLKENTLFFDTIEEAVKERFRPCKLCRPDIKERDYDPDKELADSIKRRLYENCNKHIDIDMVSRAFGISGSHLARIFKRYYGVTINDFLTKARMNKAIQLLSKSNMSIIEISYSVGYKSLSTFYKNFQEEVGCTPKQYRTNLVKYMRIK